MISVAEQVELATRVHAVLGGRLEIGDRWFRVVRFHNEIRFFGASKFQGENGPDAHVAIHRADLARAQTLPCEFQDRKLAATCEAIVTGALTRI